MGGGRGGRMSDMRGGEAVCVCMVLEECVGCCGGGGGGLDR